jgi:hypothetical protein
VTRLSFTVAGIRAAQTDSSFQRNADIDMKGVHKDVAAVEGVKGVHVSLLSLCAPQASLPQKTKYCALMQELHVWSLTQTKAIAALHLTVASDSLTAFMALSRKIQSCLHYWGIHAVTIQPEFAGVAVASDNENDEMSAITSPRRAGPDTEVSGCRMRCPSQLCEEACC